MNSNQICLVGSQHSLPETTWILIFLSVEFWKKLNLKFQIVCISVGYDEFESNLLGGFATFSTRNYLNSHFLVGGILSRLNKRLIVAENWISNFSLPFLFSFAQTLNIYLIVVSVYLFLFKKALKYLTSACLRILTMTYLSLPNSPNLD